MTKNIVLIGMRGTGKSTIGKRIAEKLAYNFFDLDEQVELSMNKSITQMVDEKGWGEFRLKEAEICELISQKSGAVIATGGGVVLNKKNIRNLKENGIIILLTAPDEILLKRRSNDPHESSRPLLGQNRAEEIAHLWKERRALYHDAADHVYDTSHEDIDTCALHIISLLK